MKRLPVTASRQEKKMTLKHGGRETLATNQLKVKSMRRITYETKNSTVKYKGTRTHWVQYLYPLYSISTCPIVT